MRVISWNIGWGCKKEKIAPMLHKKMGYSDCVVCLQEVTPSVKNFLCTFLGNSYSYIYSLDSRYVGDFDTKSRKLGVLIILSNSFKFLYSHTLSRTPFPDRTLLVSFAYMGVEYRVMTLHSVTGCNYLKAKSVQFYSFAEAIKHHQPDIVAFDANEPREDHFDEEQRKYFDNKDKGAGAKTFFQTLVNSNLQDSYATLNKEQYKNGEPLAISHIINGKERKRYDFIYTNRKFEIVKSEYLYQEAIDASADHAMVVTDLIGDMQYRMRDPNIDFDVLPFEGNTSLEELLSYCLYYKGEDDYPESSGDDNKSHLWNYELVWVKSCQQNRHYIAQVVQDYIFAGLELFNINDGTPLSLKAILFNRYQHWCGGNGWLNDINGFKDFYLKDYKTKI